MHYNILVYRLLDFFPNSGWLQNPILKSEIESFYSWISDYGDYDTTLKLVLPQYKLVSTDIQLLKNDPILSSKS